MKSDDMLEQLIVRVQAGARYRDISADLIRKVGIQELSKGRTLKEAVKATRNKLHQVGGAFQEQVIDYPSWKQELAAVSTEGDDPELRKFCTRMMALHVSTRERLPILETFFSTTLGGLGPIHSIMDLACGLNPLALPWMPLAEDAVYYGCDIYRDMTDFLNTFITHLGRQGKVTCCNLVGEVPTQQVQVALLLKTLPCLEQVDKAIGNRLLDGIKAEHLLVSFPAHSLGGRSKGMVKNYSNNFSELIADQPWKVQRFEFSSELVYLLSR
jgi:16S rRNA (guanine(1405)-N(7))-methyltransferase